MARRTKALKKKLTDDTPHPVDIHVGERIKIARKMVNMRQAQLAEILGLTFQQIQKYEKGLNRVSASRLWELTQIFGVPVDFFFENLEKKLSRKSCLPGMPDDLGDASGGFETDFILSVQDRELLMEYKKIQDPKILKAVLNLVKSIAAEPDSSDKSDSKKN